MTSTTDNVASIGVFARALGRLRSRWRLRRVLEALAITLAVVAIASLSGVLLMDHLRFQPEVVAAVRIAVYVVVTATLVLLVLPRMFKHVTHQQIARYAETHDSNLDALVLSALEAVPVAKASDALDNTGSTELSRRLVRRAGDRLHDRDPTARFERRKIWRASFASIAILGLMLLAVLLGPAGLRHGAELLWFPRAEAVSENPYWIELSPGNTDVIQKSDQLITARIHGFEPHSLILFTRTEGDEHWQQAEMTLGQEGGEFESFLFNLDKSVDYYVAGEGVRSAQHRLEVLLAPTVSRIDLLYQYPLQSGRSPELVTDTGDIRAVRGTRVEVRVTPSVPLDTGSLLIDGERPLELTERDGVLVGSVDVEGNGHYRIELPVAAGRLVQASPEYVIEALADTMPWATITSPGRDIDVTSIEEVQFDVKASDDTAVRNLELVLWVNGVADEVFPLAAGKASAQKVEAQHILYLEDRDLAPGDLIGYYARAADALDDPNRVVTTDIYFMKVRPFDRQFRRARGSGGGGRGGQGFDDALAAQQRQLVIALFKLQRDRAVFSDEAFIERLETLASAQTRIRNRVDAIVRRLESRNILDLRPALQQMAKELPKASAAMLRVEALLAAEESNEALPPARTALLHLQRADAAFREVQVALNNQGGGGGSANDLANLFRLEMDKFRSQYEHVQRGRWESDDQQFDETMRRLQELARRQQQELERMKRREPMGQGGSASQRALAERVETLLRQLERLTRENLGKETRDALQAAREAVEAMRKGAAEGDVEQSRIALERLREAKRLLDAGRTDGLAQGIDRALRQAESLSQRQDEIRRLFEGDSGGEGSDAVVRQAREQKQQMVTDIRGLDSKLDRLTDKAQVVKPKASQTLSEARETLHAAELVERVKRTQQMLADDPTTKATELEAGITRTLDSVRDKIRTARALAANAEQARERSREALRALVRAQDTAQQNLRAEARAQGGPSGGPAGGAADTNGVATGGTADGGNLGGWDGNRMADVRRNFIEGGQQLRSMHQDINSILHASGDIEAVIEGLLAMAESKAGVEDLVEQHARVLATLKAIERQLRTEVPVEATKLVATDRVEPAIAYRNVVDEYYRRLSEEGTKAANPR